MLAHWRGLYPCTVRSQPSAALQEQLVRASRAGQALSCAKARPMLLAASQRAFWLRPPAISRRDMMTGGGSAVKRLICGITAAGAAIAGGSSAIASGVPLTQGFLPPTQRGIARGRV